MVGVFIQPISGNGVFVGSDLLHNEKDNSLTGKLHDYYGESLINGSLDLNKGLMKFDKKYLDKDDVINYDFEKEKGLWIGKFNGRKSLYGEAMCEIFEVGAKPKINWNYVAKNAKISYEGSEKWTPSLVEEMKNKGYIEIIKDSESGEDLIKLTEEGEGLVPEELKEIKH